MREFWVFVRKYVSSYKKYIVGSIFANILAAVLNLGAFSLIIPILRSLFSVDTEVRSFIPWHEVSFSSFSALVHSAEILSNNFFYYLQEMVATHGMSYALLVLCIYLAVMTFLKCLFGYLALYAIIPISTGVVYDLRNRLNEKILSLPISAMSEEHKGDILARISGDVNEVETSVIGVLECIIRNPILFVIYLTALLILSWQLTLFVFLVLPPAGYAMGVIGKKLRQKSVESHNQWGVLMSMVEETLSGLRVIKAFNAEHFIAQRFARRNLSYKQITHHMSARQQLAHPVSEFLGTVTIAVILWYGGNLISSGSSAISAPVFIFYLIVFYHIINPAKELSRASYSIGKGMASVQRIEAVLEKLEERSVVGESVAPQLVTFSHGIEFKDVSFRYGERWVIRNLNLSVRKGQTVALVGTSGAGKTTLVDLLPRFYEVEEGSITIDGIDTKQIPLSKLRSFIGYVNQSPILFNDTVFNNIAFSHKSATVEEVERAARIANAHEFIVQLDGGYDYNIGDGGSKLSGGQRQRLSIARAILRNPEILILDEATSALDNVSEQLVQEAINTLLRDRTTFVVAHRMSTIVRADLICVMEQGRIVEQGTHEELLALNGVYTHLYRTQFSSEGGA